MSNKKNVKVDAVELAKRIKVAQAMSDVYSNFVLNEDIQNADVTRFAVTNYLGGSTGIKLIDPDSLFLLE